MPFVRFCCENMQGFKDIFWLVLGCTIIWFDSYDVVATIVNQVFQNSSSESIIVCHYIWKMINVFVRIWQMFNSTIKRELFVTKWYSLCVFAKLCQNLRQCCFQKVFLSLTSMYMWIFSWEKKELICLFCLSFQSVLPSCFGFLHTFGGTSF